MLDLKRKELKAKVEKLNLVHRTCSQVSFAVLNEQFELKADQTIPALMLFAGGIVGNGETCGAVTGSLLAIGFYFESLGQKQIKIIGSSNEYGELFFDRFIKKFGSTRCKEIVKYQYGKYYDFKNPKEKKSFMEDSQKNRKCIEVVKKAIFIASDIILENS
jgi:C_GCAxxG_C_C family probable redox protein